MPHYWTNGFSRNAVLCHDLSYCLDLQEVHGGNNTAQHISCMNFIWAKMNRLIMPSALIFICIAIIYLSCASKIIPLSFFWCTVELLSVAMHIYSLHLAVPGWHKYRTAKSQLWFLFERIWENKCFDTPWRWILTGGTVGVWTILHFQLQSQCRKNCSHPLFLLSMEK